MIKIGQVWKNNLGAKLTILGEAQILGKPFGTRQWVASVDIRAEDSDRVFLNRQSLDECGYLLLSDPDFPPESERSMKKVSLELKNLAIVLGAVMDTRDTSLYYDLVKGVKEKIENLSEQLPKDVLVASNGMLVIEAGQDEEHGRLVKVLVPSLGYYDYLFREDDIIKAEELDDVGKAAKEYFIL